MLSKSHCLVVHPWRVGYIRVPKVANTSIRSVIAQSLNLKSRKYSPQNDIFWKQVDSRTVEFIGNDLLMSEYHNYWTFSIVRDPVSRLVSCYNNKILRNKNISLRMKNMGCYLGMPFTDFVECVSNTDDNEIDIHLLPQSAMLLAGDKLAPSFIGYFENLDADWLRVRKCVKERAGLDLPTLPKKNSSRVKNNESLVGIESECVQLNLSKIINRYKDDCHLFYPSRL